MLDYCGRQGKVGAFDGKTCCVPEICVWKAGKRYRYDTIPERPEHKRFTLIPFGMVGEIINGIKNPEPYDWEQTLDTDKGFMQSECKFDGLSIGTRAYVHFDFDLLSVKKTFDRTADYSFVYKLKGADEKRLNGFVTPQKKSKTELLFRTKLTARKCITARFMFFAMQTFRQSAKMTK